VFFFEPPLQDISDGGSIRPESRLESNSANDSVFPLTKSTDENRRCTRERGENVLTRG